MKKKIIIIISIILICLLSVVAILVFANNSSKNLKDDSPATASIIPSKSPYAPTPSSTPEKKVVIEDYTASEVEHDSKAAMASAPADAEIEVNGKRYDGSLYNVNYQVYNGAEYYEYKGAGCIYSIYAGTDIVNGFYRLDYEGVGSCTKEECIEIAKKYASQFVDVDKYQLVSAEISGDASDEYYLVTCRKFIDDVMTADGFTVSVSTDGTPESYGRMYYKEFDDENMNIDAIREELKYIHSPEVIQKINDDIKGYQNYKDHKLSEMLVVLEDGSYAMKYTAEIHLSDYATMQSYIVTRK